MTKSFTRWMPVLGMAVLLFACSETEPLITAQKQDIKEIFINMTPEQNQKLMNYFSSETKAKKGAVKMAAFTSSAGFGILQNLVFGENGIEEGQIGIVRIGTDSKDFVRKNTDGTYSVSYKDSDADLSYYDFGTEDEYTGTGNGVASYTGELLEFGPFKLITIDPSNNAAVIHGNGKVSDGTDEYTMLFKWIGNKNKSSAEFSLK